jgi:hypothetical protein
MAGTREAAKQIAAVTAIAADRRAAGYRLSEENGNPDPLLAEAGKQHDAAVAGLNQGDVQTGKEKWKFQSGSLVYTKPFLTTKNVYAGSADENLYCLQKSTGEKRWSYKTSGCVYSSPMVDSKTVYVGSDDGFFYAIDEGAKPHKAVYVAIPKDPRLEAFTIDKKITPYLKDRGFEQLDSTKLFHFLEGRINDGAPSVIVFAYDQIPSNVIGVLPLTVNFRLSALP